MSGGVWMLSAVLVHFVVVAFVVAGCYVIHPVLMVEIPAYSLLNAFLKLQGRFPTEFTLELAGIDGVAHIVTEAVSDIRYESF